MPDAMILLLIGGIVWWCARGRCAFSRRLEAGVDRARDRRLAGGEPRPAVPPRETERAHASPARRAGAASHGWRGAAEGRNGAPSRRLTREERVREAMRLYVDGRISVEEYEAELDRAHGLR